MCDGAATPRGRWEHGDHCGARPGVLGPCCRNRTDCPDGRAAWICAARNPGDEYPIVRDGGGRLQQSDGVWRSERRKFPRVVLFSFARGSEVHIDLLDAVRRRHRSHVAEGGKFGSQTDAPALSPSRLDDLVRSSTRAFALVWRHSLYLWNVRAFRLSLPPQESEDAGRIRSRSRRDWIADRNRTRMVLG